MFPAVSDEITTVLVLTDRSVHLSLRTLGHGVNRGVRRNRPPFCNAWFFLDYFAFDRDATSFAEEEMLTLNDGTRYALEWLQFQIGVPPRRTFPNSTHPCLEQGVTFSLVSFPVA